MDEKFSFCCSPIFYYFFIGNGSTRPTKNKYDNAPKMHNIPAVAKGTKNEPWVSVSITPVNVVINIPAKLPAKFMMPPIDATCLGVGEISPTITHVLEPAKESDA